MLVNGGINMFKVSELRQKEIISLSDGKRLGFATDIEINMETGYIEAIVIPAENRIFSIFSRETDVVLTWQNIKKIGVDVILIDING